MGPTKSFLEYWLLFTADDGKLGIIEIVIHIIY